MKKIFFAAFFAFECFALFAKQNLDDVLSSVSKDIADRCDKREIIAILDFKAQSKDMSEYINSQLTAMIFENSTLQVVTRQHMDMIEKELRFQSSGVVSDSTALSIGERLGAHAIVFGSLDELENSYTLQVKMLNVSSGSYALFKKYQFSRSAKSEQLLKHSARIYKSSLGLVFEANKNSLSNVSPAMGISFDYGLFRRLSLGVKSLVSWDAFEKYNSVFVIEPLAFVRWYVVSPSGEPSSGLFAEGQGGVELIFVNDGLEISASAGGAIGFRFPIGSFYVEPYLRGGYPYIFGAGVGGGFRF